jgi:probable phosphoglycerate mutase
VTEIILIRHGETDWNAEKRLQGHLDTPLNAEGQRQAAALGHVLRDEAIDAIFASDLQRAIKTAEAIAEPHRMQVTIDAGLRERGFGAFEGLLRTEMAVAYPEAFAALQARDIDACYPAGKNVAETLRDFSTRVMQTMTRLATTGQHKKIVMVTHGGVLDCVYRASKGIALSKTRDFDILNTALNRIVWDGASFTVTEWGNVAHLAEPALDELVR